MTAHTSSSFKSDPSDGFKFDLKFYPIHQENLTDLFDNVNLILPSPNGLAFMGQLAIDLLVCHYEMEKIGYLDSIFVPALIGPDPFQGDKRKMSTALEVFRYKDCETNQIYILLQLRSRVIKGYGGLFIQELVQWIQEFKFKKVIVLTGLDSAFLSDRNLLQERFGFLSSDKQEIEYLKNKFANISLVQHQTLEKHSTFRILPPGCGLSNILVKNLTANKIHWTFMTWYTSEGDNFEAAQVFSTRIAQFLFPETQNDKMSWKVPNSWKAHLQNIESQLEMIY